MLRELIYREPVKTFSSIFSTYRNLRRTKTFLWHSDFQRLEKVIKLIIKKGIFFCDRSYRLRWTSISLVPPTRRGIPCPRWPLSVSPFYGPRLRPWRWRRVCALSPLLLFALPFILVVSFSLHSLLLTLIDCELYAVSSSPSLPLSLIPLPRPHKISISVILTYCILSFSFSLIALSLCKVSSAARYTLNSYKFQKQQRFVAFPRPHAGSKENIWNLMTKGMWQIF